MFKKKKEDITEIENVSEVESNTQESEQKEEGLFDTIKNHFKLKNHRIVLITVLVAFALFIVSFGVKYVINGVIIPALNTSQTQLNDWNFIWGETEKSIEGDISVWKKATTANKVEKISSSKDYVRLQMTVSPSSADKEIQYYTFYAPSKVEINGAAVYENGYSKKNVVGNVFNSFTVKSAASEQTVDVYIYSPIGFNFSALDISQSGHSVISVGGIGMFLSMAIVLLSLIFFAITSVITKKNKNIAKLALLCLTTFFAGASMLVCQLGYNTASVNNPIFYNMQLFFDILFAGSTAISALFCCSYKGKMNQIVIGVVAAFGVGSVLLINNPLVLSVIGIVYAVLISIVLAYLMFVFADCIEEKKPYSKTAAIIFAYISIVNIYDIITFVLGKNGFTRMITCIGGTVYALIMFIIFFKQSVNLSIVLEERNEQMEHNSQWFKQIANMLSKLIVQKNDNEFAINASKIISDIIVKNEISINDIFSKEEEDEQIDIYSTVAVIGNDGKYQEIYNDSSIDDCDYLEISKIYDNNGEKIRYAETYLDMMLIKENEVSIIFHFENFTCGLNTLFKDIISTAHSNMETVYQNYNLKNDMEIVQESSIITLAETVEYKSMGIKIHLYSVSAITKVLCEEMGFSEHETRVVSSAAIVHDIGKIAISDEIINGNKALTPEQRETIKQHVTYGYNILSKSRGEFMNAAAVIAYQHHEKYDGTGYNGIKGEDIHIYARIVALADVFDALYSKRSYKEAWSAERVKNYIIEASGTQFDPQVVNVFESCFDKVLEAHKAVEEKYKD